MADTFTPEDTVALKEDPSINGIVERSWRDVDSSVGLGHREWIPHSGVTEGDIKRAIREGQIPRGMVEVRLTDPYFGCALLKEEELVLKDRGLVTGDVVKRNPSDAESGYVIKTELECVCRPVYTDLPFRAGESWDHKPEDNEIRVPAEELAFPDFEEGTHVIYRGWVGEVTFVWDEVTVRLGNGSVVRVHKPEELDAPSHDLHSTKLRAYRNTKSLAETLKDEYRRMEKEGPTITTPPEAYYAGQRLTTTKSNLRLGEWIIGSYTPSQPPNVVVVESRAIEIEVAWLTYNVFSSQPPSPPPPNSLDGHELEELILYNKHNKSGMPLSSNDLGSRRSQSIVVGDHVTFRDPAGAAVKYSSSSPNHKETGIFRRIPRILTDGFEMNTFSVRETTQRVRVQWQDGTTSEEASTNVIPYLNVDENDLWPGELCSLKSAEETKYGMIKLNRIGVVQSVNAKERMAKVRWFSGTNLSIFEENPVVLEPGSVLGQLSQETTEVSVYEVIAYPGITKRRGDLVLISPNEQIIAVQQARALDAATIGREGTRTANLLMDGLNPQQLALDPQQITSTSEARWFGEIIDLGLDGLLTVRLGALEEVEDIKVPVTRVNVVVGDDDADFPSDADDEYDDDGYSAMSDKASSLTSEERVIEETIIYEGGQRLDDNEDDNDWMTDESDTDIDLNEDADTHVVTNGKQEYVETTNDLDQDHEMADAANVTGKSVPPPSELLNHTDYDFSRFSYKPKGFEILDESAASDHHYVNHETTLSANLLRRIRKEHKILNSSLPDGIWVRTWAERLDILRILILGPRATPYELAPFILDVLFKDDFPNSPPQVYFHSWTNSLGRINPNLYEDGKVCLSILGTWPENDKNEGWNREKSSLLQVLVSLMGLVLVEQPYYNEAGFESLVGTEDTQFASQMYSEKAYCMAKGFVEQALRHPVQGVHDIVHWLYLDPQGLGLLAMVVKESHDALARGKQGAESGAGAREGGAVGQHGITKRSSMRLSTGAEVLLRRYLPGLEQRLAALATS